MKLSVGIGIIFAAFQLLGCKNETALDKDGKPEKLIIGAVSGGLDPTLRRDMFIPIQKYLSEQIKMPVEVMFAGDYTAVIEALRAKKVHMAYLPPFAYVIAKRNLDITPIIVVGTRDRPSSYKSIIITSNPAIKSMDDVKAHSKELNLGFAEPASASGHLIPKAYLMSIGLDPKTSFKEVIFAGGHLAGVMAVKSGKIDIDCTTHMIIDLMIKKGMIKEGDLRILWLSDPIVADPIVVRDDLNKDLVKKIQEAFLNMNTNDPKMIENFYKVYLKQEDAANKTYLVAYDSMYDGLRKIASGVSELN